MEGGDSIPKGHIISCLKSSKMIPKWCLYYILTVKELDSKTPPIVLVPVVRDSEVFPIDIPRISP